MKQWPTTLQNESELNTEKYKHSDNNRYSLSR